MLRINADFQPVNCDTPDVILCENYSLKSILVKTRETVAEKMVRPLFRVPVICVLHSSFRVLSHGCSQFLAIRWTTEFPSVFSILFVAIKTAESGDCFHTFCSISRIEKYKIKGLGLSQNTKTERFGGQPERSVFPVWVLTGFACYSARKSRLPHAVFRKCIYTCCACSSSNNRIDSNVCSCYNWNERLKKALECS